MPSPTRRDALHAAAALLTGAAGCTGESSSSSSYPTDSTGNLAFDPESYRLRNPDPTPAVWTGERPTQTDEERHLHADSHFFLTGPESADGVGFADVDGADAARDFLESTDYDSTTVYVEQASIRECYTTTLCHVEWSTTEIETSYARAYRDVDVACEADARDMVATLIRIPEAFDPSEVNGYGRGTGSASCERHNEHVRTERASQ
jgi:hypothetical protein